ncbi:hypothetical protein [Streptomyces sp. NPDC018000]|uniref:hypothetical protein n=1 Tax=Streptomyces sp. NPDC018000 TaxID=3365028 RepID=UPI00379521E6
MATLPPDDLRRAVREAARRLRVDTPRLTSGSAEAYQAGLDVRLDDLREAILTAWGRGVPVSDIAADAELTVSTVDEWIAGVTPRIS